MGYTIHTFTTHTCNCDAVHLHNHVDRSDRKMSMPPDLKTEVRDAKTEPIGAQLAILASPYLWFKQEDGRHHG